MAMKASERLASFSYRENSGDSILNFFWKRLWLSQRKNPHILELVWTDTMSGDVIASILWPQKLVDRL